MTLPAIEYYRPGNLAEGLQLLKDNAGKVRPLAGGTDLITNMKVGLNPAQVLVDLTGIEGLAAIECSKGKPVKAGAAATIWDFVHQKEIMENLPALNQAGCGVGAVQHQQMGTIGGNLCQDTRCLYYNQTRHWRKARPLCYKTGGNQCLAMKNSERCHAAICSDLAPALIAFEAKVKISSVDGDREIALADLYTGEGKVTTILGPGEIVSQVIIPGGAWNSKSGYVKLRSRKSIDFPQAGAAVVLKLGDGKINGANVVLTALESGPVVVKDTDSIFGNLSLTNLNAKNIAVLAQKCAEAASKEILPAPNMTWKPGYRRRMVSVLIEEALAKAIAE